MMNDDFLALIKHPIKFRLFLLTKLPSAYFSGVRLQSIDASKAVVTVPYQWFSTNPFKSTYFACLSMAAEMSTGVLAMGHSWKKSPGVSMLVKNISGDFTKKATQRTTFICNDGEKIALAIAESEQTGEAVECRASSTGFNQDGETVASFFITWSFKVKSPKKN